MRKYKKFLVIPAIIVIAVSIFSGFSNPDVDKIAMNLIKERTSILQKSFYGQMSLQDAEKKLYEIETYPLLSQDIQSVREWETGELDIIRRMNIATFEQEKNYMNYLTYRAVIYWDMTGLSDNYTVKGTYHIVLKRENDQYKLSVFEPIDD